MGDAALKPQGALNVCVKRQPQKFPSSRWLGKAEESFPNGKAVGTPSEKAYGDVQISPRKISKDSKRLSKKEDIEI